MVAALASSIAAALDSAASDLEHTGASFEPGVLDADGAYTLALNAIARALKGISEQLQKSADDNSIGQEEPVQRDVAEVDVALPDLDNTREALDCGMVGRSQIHIPNLKDAEITFIVGKNGGDLVVKLPSILG